MTTKSDLAAAIAHLNPCGDAVKWLRGQPSAKAAWESCNRGDWMMWLVGRLSGPPESDSRKKLVLVACACARLSLPHVRPGDDRPLQAIETVERYARGEGPRLEDVRKAAYAAYAAYTAACAYATYADAADSAYAYAAAYAAYAADSAAAYAAYAADSAAAYAADSAAYAAAYADAYAAAYAYTRSQILCECADIIRRHYTLTDVQRMLRASREAK